MTRFSDQISKLSSSKKTLADAQLHSANIFRTRLLTVKRHIHEMLSQALKLSTGRDWTEDNDLIEVKRRVTSYSI
jgi:hypothetical protein